MDVLWAPWRMDYILGPKPDACVFCLPQTRDEDRERLVLARGRYSFVIMNKFPYNSGHLMVTPLRHARCLTELSGEENLELTRGLAYCTRVIKECMKPQGINIGLNLGEAAGSGIAAHLHYQMVPRWNGDSSFMAVFSETRVMPQLLVSTYDRLVPFFSDYLATVTS
ncbi:HIT family protein [Desulfovibrio sp. DV]|uniref:HIT family protein n=1 Tax=Desulfovibrio sp. DV TaxID=1844708 RepID=UPI00094B82C6|nr:HIT domain-containing protein [Desulfovibrio sp. DV]OLN31005.1 HIT family protein [Desulfovibrio sp. DV]